MMVHNQLAQISNRLKSSSAVVPALMLTLICTPTGLLTAKLASGVVSIVGLTLAIVPPLLASCQIVFFTIFDRDRLHNEDHVERKMMISRGIGDSQGFVASTIEQPLIANPSAKGAGDAQ